MKSSTRFLVTGVLALLVCVSAIAQTPEASPLPVTEPLDVGGTILQPGNYLIRVAPTRSDRDTIQVLSADGKEVLVTVRSVPHYFEPGEETPNSMYVYYPSGEGAPRALRTWFARFPEASQGGHDIVYAESRAKQLARLAKSNVVFTTADATSVSVVTPEATVETYTPPTMTVTTTTPVTTPETTVTESTTQTIDTETDTTADTSMASQSTQMPDTAGEVPLMALLGLASLGAAVVVRKVRA
jgi:hypothetical protein